MVNTGWAGSSASSGSKRIDLKLTKHIDLITDRKLDFHNSIKDKFFNFDIPLSLGLDNDFLVPEEVGTNLDEYYRTGNMLTELFNENFKKLQYFGYECSKCGSKKFN